MNNRILRFSCLAGVVVIGVAGMAVSFTGCQGLDYSARAEGTGIQVIGAIVVLAKYKASERQKAVAEAQARRDYARAAKPVYRQRRAKVQADARKRVAAVERDYGRKIEAAKMGAGAPASLPVPPAVIERQQRTEIAKIEADAAAETAALDEAYHSIGGQPDQPRSQPEARKIAVRPIPSTEELARSLAPKGPQYIAVPVPPQDVAAERGGKATYMLWDTHRQRLASDDVLVLNRGARPGTTVKLEGVSARVSDGGQ